MADTPIRGRFLWHELMTTDTRSAADFFTKIIGWKTQPFANNPSYTLFTVNKMGMAGLMTLPEEAKAGGTPPSWMCYVGTPDVDATAKQATALGGKIMKAASDIPTVGRFAVIQDPQGAVFIAFTPLQGPQRADAPPTIGDFSWHELTTTDWRAALSFYQSLFGWEATSAMDMGPEMGTYQMFGINGRVLGGMMNKPKQMPGPPAWMPYIRVADARKVAESVKKLGAPIINGPMEVPGGDWIAQGLDHQGAVFAVHSLKPVAAAPAPAPAKAAKAKPARKPAKKKVVKKASKKAVKKAAKRKVVKKAAKKRAPKKPARKAAARKKKKTAKRRR